MSSNAPNSLKRQIESRWAANQDPSRIAFELETTRDYVDRVIYFANRRPTPITEMQGDDDKHIRLIAKANKGMGFPFCGQPAPAPRVHTLENSCVPKPQEPYVNGAAQPSIAS